MPQSLDPAAARFSLALAAADDFVLVDGGRTVNHDDLTYALGNYFDGSNIQPETYASGYLVFFVNRQDTYTLVFHGPDGEVIKKTIVVTEGPE